MIPSNGTKSVVIILRFYNFVVIITFVIAKYLYFEVGQFAHRPVIGRPTCTYASVHIHGKHPVNCLALLIQAPTSQHPGRLHQQSL